MVGMNSTTMQKCRNYPGKCLEEERKLRKWGTTCENKREAGAEKTRERGMKKECVLAFGSLKANSGQKGIELITGTEKIQGK